MFLHPRLDVLPLFFKIFLQDSKIGAIHSNPGFAQTAHNHNTLLNGKGKKQSKFLKLSYIIIKHGEQLLEKYWKDRLIYSY